MRIRILLATLLALATVAAAPPGMTTSQTDLFLRMDGTGCTDTVTYLSTVAGQNEPGCGYVGGAPIGELYHAGVAASTVKNFSTNSSGVPLVLDATRNITGVNRIVASSAANRTAAGQVRVDVTATGKLVGGSTTSLGSHTVTITWDPTKGEVDIPFTIDVPDTLDARTLSSLSLDVDIRGLHVLTGYHRLNGQSKLTVPTYVPSS